MGISVKHRQYKSKLYIIIIFAALCFCSFCFIQWISQLVFKNTCIELQEQYISIQVKDVIETIETSINFGKDIESYYGMEELLNQIITISDSDLQVSLLDKQGSILYTTYKNTKEGSFSIARLLSSNYQEELKEITQTDIIREVDFGELKSMIYPFYKDTTVLLGYMILVYSPHDLYLTACENITDKKEINTSLVEIILLIIISIVLSLFYLFTNQEREKRWYIRFMPIVLMMTAILIYIFSIFQVYTQRYQIIIEHNAISSAKLINDSIESLVKKGFDIERIEEVSKYINKKIIANDSIGNISIVKCYYNANEQITQQSEDALLHIPITGTELQLDIYPSQNYVTKKVITMTFTFLAIFIICLMIIYELTSLAEIIMVRVSKTFNTETKEQFKVLSSQIRFFSFIAYTAVYISTPYAAVIMRKWHATVWNFSESVSASFPLTIELFFVLLTSVFIQKVFRNIKLNQIGMLTVPFLVLGNLACTKVHSPYLLICLRAFCGIGFAFLKYWLNSIIVAASEDREKVGFNYAKSNAGLIGGITVGASFGAILAEALGYQFNYYFTAFLSCTILLFGFLCLPWKLLNTRREKERIKTGYSAIKLIQIIKTPSVLKMILLGCIPLNIGLMYIVAFLPVYIDYIGQTALTVSYAYLINGLSGTYIGVTLVALLQRLSKKNSVILTILFAFCGVFLLVIHPSIATLMISAGIFGLFDGFGTPNVTSYFTSLKAVKEQDTTSMLMIFNSIGSAVQIICPILYNILIEPNGKTTKLAVFGICYFLVALFFFLFMEKEENEIEERMLS